jgi:hypothetical protein
MAFSVMFTCDCLRSRLLFKTVQIYSIAVLLDSINDSRLVRRDFKFGKSDPAMTMLKKKCVVCLTLTVISAGMPTLPLTLERRSVARA